VPGWLRTSFVVAVVMGGALLLWVGFALLVAVLLIVAIPFSIWSTIARRRQPKGGPVIFEGSATRVGESALPPRVPQDEGPRAETGSADSRKT
jgi:hypothetical protein